MYLRKTCSMLTLAVFSAGLWFYCFGAPWAMLFMERETKQHLKVIGCELAKNDTVEAYYDRSTQYKYFSRVSFAELDEEWVFCYDVTGKLQRIE